MRPSMEEIVMGAIDEGLLEEEGIDEGMLAVHEFMAEAGLDPENPDVYTAVIATISMIAAHTYTGGDPVTAMEAVGRFACRAYQEIIARG